MLFGTWSEAHAYDSSDYIIETRLNEQTLVLHVAVKEYFEAHF